MTHQTSLEFSKNAARAQADSDLQSALEKLQRDTRLARPVITGRLPEFEALRDRAVAIKNHTLAHLDHYLETFEANVIDAGGHVHWCNDSSDARDTIMKICRDTGAKTVGKGKSMVSEEIALNDFLIANGLDVVETDLGEYILQLRKETPSHVVMPAIHLKKEQIATTFREHHTELDPARPLDVPGDMTEEARIKLREKFLAADVGITGANMLIAETGSIVVKETVTLPRHCRGFTSSSPPSRKWCRASTTPYLSCAFSRGRPPGRRLPATPPSPPDRNGRTTWTGRRNFT